MQEALVQPWVRKLRSHLSWGMAQKKKVSSCAHVNTRNKSHIWQVYRIGSYYTPFRYHEFLIDIFLNIRRFSKILLAVCHWPMSHIGGIEVVC